MGCLDPVEFDFYDITSIQLQMENVIEFKDCGNAGLEILQNLTSFNDNDGLSREPNSVSDVGGTEEPGELLGCDLDGHPGFVKRTEFFIGDFHTQGGGESGHFDYLILDGWVMLG